MVSTAGWEAEEACAPTRDRFAGLKRLWTGDDDGFDPVAIFRRLYTFERVLLVSLVVLASAFVMGGMLSSNLAPHFKALYDANGLNTAELTSCLNLSGSVLIITVMSYFIYARWIPLLQKLLMIVVACLVLHGNIKNSAGIQARDREARAAPYSKESERIKYLNERIPGLEATWKDLTEGNGSKLPDVATALAELEARKDSADNECHFGKIGRQRGPKCDDPERERRERPRRSRRS